MLEDFHPPLVRYIIVMTEVGVEEGGRGWLVNYNVYMAFTGWQ